jgi:hypothetical protein
MHNGLKTMGLGVLCAVLAHTAALADVKITSQETGGWQVEAQNEPLTGVLGAIAKTAGIKVSGTAKLVENPMVTGVYEGSLDTVLRRLLRNSDYAFQTIANEDGTRKIIRLVVLSGVKGKAPNARAIKAARKLPVARRINKPLSAEEKDQGTRVASLLNKRAQLVVGAGAEAAPEKTPEKPPAQGNTGITRNADGSFDITPEAQARMAEATRRAQQDLQALVSSLRRNENNQSGGN